QVGGGEPQRAAARLTVHHPATHVVPSAQCGAGTFGITGGQELAHSGGGPARPAVLGGVGHQAYLEPPAAGECTHGVAVPGIPGTEAHVLPHHHGAYPQCLHQVAPHELLGGELGEVEGIGNHQGRVDAGGGEQLEPVL